MATMRQIRSRIRVAKNIQQITKAMKMVAAARLKRAQNRVEAARPYALAMDTVVRDLAQADTHGVEHPLLEARQVTRIGVVVITSDRGMCGSYNSALCRFVAEHLRQYEPSAVRLYVLGRKGQAFFKRLPYEVLTDVAAEAEPGSLQAAAELYKLIETEFLTGQVDELHVAFTQFVTAITQNPTITRILPVDTGVSEEATAGREFIFEPAAGDLLASLLPRQLKTQIFQALLEASASEHGARMTSMTSATDNASKMISELTLSLNRARQATITKEITEIVSGAEALKS